ncbi:MAG: hypothetical protein RQ899_07640 [Pseudomonadales bacterium]|nr:hypothetical protein [Pseudomonadales bacterium]
MTSAKNTAISLARGLALALLGHAVQAADMQAAVTSGELIVEPPTLISLGFEWFIEGDDNRNASVALSYRKVGETRWREGLPLLRVQNERTVYGETLDYTAPNMFAGSIFYLEPDTQYEARFELADADGVIGQAVRSVTIRTRAEPMASASGRILHVYPPGHSGAEAQPAYHGLLEAYYMTALGGDWSRASPPRVRPGDTILVHAGVYKELNRLNYSHEIQSGYTTCCGTPWDGTYYLTADGTAEQPITIKAAGDGEAIFDGDGNTVLFNLMGGDHHLFEGLTFRNTGIAIEAGQKGIAGSVGLAVKHSRFEDLGVAVHSDWSGSRNFYIADNVMIGRRPQELFGWYNIPPWNTLPDFETRRLLQSYYAVSVYGSGHVIAYNKVAGFHDALDHATYGMPDDYPNTPRERMPVSIDIYGNDVSNVDDNCFEADGSMHNMRVFNNRCFNAAVGAMSPQPVFGGPVYFIRNVVYHSPYGPVKIHADPAGILYYHNTYIGEIRQLTPASNLHLRNNLIFGQGRQPAVMAIQTSTNYSSSDYNGFRLNPGSDIAFSWNSPPEGIARRYGEALVARNFADLPSYQQGSGQDSHSRLLDFDIFVNAAMPDLDAPTRLYDPETVDLRLKRGAGAIDAGTVLPNIDDGFAGRAPDLGAYEYGQPLPHYGPRPQNASAKK